VSGAETPRPLVYTAQDVARFCEVDLKTIHNWAESGKIPHHRTTGRHLRFRHAHVVAFLRRHGYPIHAELAGARPTVFLAAPGPEAPLDEAALKDVARRLSSRFHVRRFATAIEAIAHLVAGQPDALVVTERDATWSGVPAASALKGSVDAGWPMLVVVTDDARGGDALRAAGADMIVGSGELGRLTAELVRSLGID
jgi:excisionase family DNA binding protein